jgi:glycosyltransferase involved in cell wall biosynthesis
MPQCLTERLAPTYQAEKGLRSSGHTVIVALECVHIDWGRAVPVEQVDAGSAALGGRPRFSVVIPAVNEAQELAGCLTSLAAQTFAGRTEIIVVDNNSDDATSAIASAHGATVLFEARPGVCWARQRGTEAARGEIVVSTDADTHFDPDWLRRIDQSFTSEPGAVAVAGPCQFIAAPRWGDLYASLLFGLVHLLYRMTGRVFYVTATNVAFRKSAWTAYDTQLTQGGDELDLLRRLRARGHVVFDPRNPTFTSARRMRRGLLYNVFVTCIFYYLVGYWLNRLFKRPLLRTAPAIRGDLTRARNRRNLGAAVVVTPLLVYWLAQLVS